MYLYCYRKQPNFGDALTDVVCRKFLDVDFEVDPGADEVFVGIGTLLNEKLPSARRLYIFGSGLGYGSVAPEQMRNWEVSFVRGPLTAKALSIDLRLGISDPAILLHRTENLNRRKEVRCSFMPHHAIDSARLREIIEGAGINYISPHAPCAEVIDEILRSDRLICSALHGAIAAEALRVPWLPVLTNNEILVSKWHDWAASLEMEIVFEHLPTIWPDVGNSLKNRIVAGVKERVCRSQLKKLVCSSKFRLGHLAILLDRLAKIEDKLSSFNASYGK